MFTGNRLRRLLVIPLVVLGLGSILGTGFGYNIGKFFRLAVTSPSGPVQAGFAAVATIDIDCGGGQIEKLTFEWIDASGNLLPRFDAGVFLPEIPESAGCRRTPVAFPTLDSSALGPRSYRLRVHHDDPAETEFGTVRFEIVAPTGNEFTLDAPAGFLIDPDTSLLTTLELPLPVTRTGFDGPITMTWAQVDHGAATDLSIVAAPNPIPQGGAASTLRISNSSTTNFKNQLVEGLIVSAQGGNTRRTRFVSFVYEPTLTAPSMPTGLQAVAETTVIDLSWDAGGAFDSYRLERSTDGVNFVVIQAALPPGTARHRDPGLASDTDYHYRLMAFNANGFSPTAQVSARTLSATGPFRLTVMIEGIGSVGSAPAGIDDCSTTCAADYAPGTDVALAASPGGSASFIEWTGHCSGTMTTTNVLMDGPKSCTARFTTPMASGWFTLASRVLTSQESHLESSVALDSNGRAYAAIVQVFGSQSRLGIYQEIPSGLFVNRGVVNANQTYSAYEAELVLDDADRPIVAFTNSDSIAVVRLDGQSFTFLSERTNIESHPGMQPQLARSGNTLVVAWVEGSRIVVRRHDLITGQWDNGVSVPNTQNARQLDLALDSAGRGVIASSFGSLGSELRVSREMADGSWVPLGGPVGERPPDAPMVVAFGLHIDAADLVRIVWTEGDFNEPIAYLSAAFFDGADWTSLFGAGFIQTIRRDFAVPRALSVNRSGPFAFAFAIETTLPAPINNLVEVYELPGGVLTPIGSFLAQPGTGYLSLAMQQPGRPTLAQSIATTQNPSEPFTLRVLRHIP